MVEGCWSPHHTDHGAALRAEDIERRALSEVRADEMRQRRGARVPTTGLRVGSAADAARVLGITVAALRKRVQRGQVPLKAIIRISKRRHQFRLDLLVG